MKAIRRILLLSALVLPSWAQHSTIPVVLVNGYQLNCTGSTSEQTNFDNLGSLLSSDGAPVYYFDNCQEDPNATIDHLGLDFGRFLGTLGQGPVDVIAHSMGGLIVRSYLAGFHSLTNTFTPPLQPGIRKLVLIGTPNFGSDWANAFTDLAGIQVSEMMPAGSFVWALGTWNQQSDDLRGIDTIAIAGSVVGGTQFGVPGDGP